MHTPNAEPEDIDAVDALVVQTMRVRPGLVAVVGGIFGAALAVGVAVMAHPAPRVIHGLGVEIEERSRDVATDPGNVELRHRLGEALVTRRAYELAEATYADIVRRSPDDAFALMRLGAVRFELGDLPGAVDALERGIAATGAPPWDAWAWLGVAHLRQGDTEGAIDALLEAVRLFPDDASTRLNLAQALDDAGRDDEAAVHLAAGLALAPDVDQARALRSRLTALRTAAGVADEPVPGVDDMALPLARRSEVWTTAAVFDGAVHAELAIDTGASATVVTSRVAAALGLDRAQVLREDHFSTAGGDVLLPVYEVAHFDAGPLSLDAIEVGVCDACEAMGIDGLIGLDILGQYVVTLDPEERTLVLSPRGTAPVRPASRNSDAALLFGVRP